MDTAKLFELSLSSFWAEISVEKVLLCPFRFKPRPSEVSLESPGLENIPQVPGNRAEVDQIHDARNVVSATL